MWHEEKKKEREMKKILFIPARVLHNFNRKKISIYFLLDVIDRMTNFCKCSTTVTCTFLSVAFLSACQYVYLYHNAILIDIVKTKFYPFVSPLRTISQTQTQLVDYIEKCPECFLFLLFNENHTEQNVLLNIINSIPVDSNAIFYPLTMKLQYNQPIRFYTILSENPYDSIRNTRLQWLNTIETKFDLVGNSLLGLIVKSLKMPVKMNELPWPNRRKLILYYTKFFGNNYWYNPNEKSVYLNDLNPRKCPISLNVCHVTIDRNLFPESDASLIHLRENLDVGKLKNLSRERHQRLIFFLKESPVHSPRFTLEKHDGIFNYTQTYRPDSDLTATTLRNFFWLFDQPIRFDINFSSIIEKKVEKKLVVAIISNCGGSSARLKYIKELKNFIPVDIYGGCGERCPNVPDCRAFVYERYKFYLAFENSLCDEYVTEKFFFSLQSASIVPVVLGWARYDRYVPSSAFIDVRNFSSPMALANYISYLDRNTTAYLEYFQWRQRALFIKTPHYICELCLKLFLDDRDKKETKLERIDQYWNSQSQCHRSKQHDDGSWKFH